tara:strand:- start:2125 stop:2316 length:192 start_codon:yes stop_codon:yes gene_type:complete
MKNYINKIMKKIIINKEHLRVFKNMLEAEEQYYNDYNHLQDDKSDKRNFKLIKSMLNELKKQL